MRQRGGGGISPDRQAARAPSNSWWDNPGRPTPYLLWGLIWCGCGTTMVPLDRRHGGAERFYRCDAGCGRPPIPATGLEREVLRAVIDVALTHLPRYTWRRFCVRRATWLRCGPDRRRDLIRRWIERVVADDGSPPRLHWLAGTPAAV
ncbi:zinc ribbon domain-containing protein [Micromonospora sp. NPDC049559]|uniref:zinc ribbon domain-containing protein n=1 Tax=Micromonospora sp. NPDC049559 TaxID=3155923 RepID=UPI00344A0FC8